MPEPIPDERRAVRTARPGRASRWRRSRFDRSLEDEHELLDAVVATAGIALENGRLRAELRARLQELQGSRVRVLEAGRQERQRLERDLHDGAQVRLVALSLELGLLGEDPAADPAVKARLRDAKDEVSASLEELRDVAQGIYPAVLSGHGLGGGAGVTGGPRRRARSSSSVDLAERPPEAVEVAAYYVVSEALANIGKHSHRHRGRGRRASAGPRLSGRGLRRRRGRTELGSGTACVVWPIGSRRSAVAYRARTRPIAVECASRRRCHVRER